MPPASGRAEPTGIHPAIPQEFPTLRQIELEADKLYASMGIGPFVLDEADDHFDTAAVVLVAGEPPVGFACVDIVDGQPHIWQLSVHPSAARRGRGAALVEAVCAWSEEHGYEEVTLTTYRDVPWNGPFYARLGFEVMERLPPELMAIREHERQIGDDAFGPRVAMHRLIR